MDGRSDYYNFRLNFERTVAQIASRFVGGVEIEKYDVIINRALKDIGVNTHADRVYIFELDHENKVMKNTYEWCAEGVEPEIDNLQGLPFEIFPWWMDRINHNRLIYIPDVSRLGKEAEEEKKILEAQTIKSLIVLPIFVFDKSYGFIGVDDVHTSEMWNENDYALLRLTAKLFSDFFRQKIYRETLVKKNQALEEAMEELKKLESKIVQKEKMSTAGQLAAGLAHEINNSVASIQSNVRSLEDFYQIIVNEYLPKIDKEKVDSDLMYIIEEISPIFTDIGIGFDHISQIVRSIRNLTEAKSSEKKFCDLNDIVKETLWVYKSKPYKDIDINYSLESTEYICCNRNELEEAVNNILKNSMESLEKSDTTNPFIQLRSYEEDQWVVLDIIDNGGGIDRKIKEKIFEPFFTTKDIGEGYGLGLSISYDIIVNSHHGEIEVDSTPGEGTKISLRFPINR